MDPPAADGWWLHPGRPGRHDVCVVERRVCPKPAGGALGRVRVRIEGDQRRARTGHQDRPLEPLLERRRGGSPAGASRRTAAGHRSLASRSTASTPTRSPGVAPARRTCARSSTARSTPHRGHAGVCGRLLGERIPGAEHERRGRAEWRRDQQHPDRLDGRRQRLHLVAQAAHQRSTCAVEEERHVGADARRQDAQLRRSSAAPGDAPRAAAASSPHRSCRPASPAPIGMRLARTARVGGTRVAAHAPRKPADRAQHEVAVDRTVRIALDDQLVGGYRRPGSSDNVSVSARSRRRNTDRSSW